ncbi:MAG: glycosyltransferase [Verrucomicrobiota bacterium]
MFPQASLFLRPWHLDISAAKIGVVTVTDNDADYLDAFLRDCWKQTHRNFNLYIIDNKSSDNILQILANQNDTRCKVIPKEQNYGFAEGSNIGIRQTLQDGCSHILLLNSDIEFPETLFEVLLHELTALHGAMIAPKIYFFDRPTCFWSAGAKFDRLRGWGAVHYGEGDEDVGQFNETRRVENAPGCCILMEGGLFERIGLLPESSSHR